MTEDTAFFFLRIGLLASVASYLIIRYRSKPAPEPEDSEEDPHTYI